MKYKTTRKELMNGYCNIITIGYCDAQYLLEYENPVAYNCGVYGWNFDVYYIEDANVAITTGYRNMVETMTYNHDKLRELDSKAREIVYNNSIGYDEKKRQVRKMLVDFLVDARNKHYNVK